MRKIVLLGAALVAAPALAGPDDELLTAAKGLAAWWRSIAIRPMAGTCGSSSRAFLRNN